MTLSGGGSMAASFVTTGVDPTSQSHPSPEVSLEEFTRMSNLPDTAYWTALDDLVRDYNEAVHDANVAAEHGRPPRTILLHLAGRMQTSLKQLPQKLSADWSM